MADVIDYEIFGDDMQLVEVELDPGGGVRAEAGATMYTEERQGVAGLGGEILGGILGGHRNF